MEDFQYLIIGLLFIFLVFEFIKNFRDYQGGRILWIGLATYLSLLIGISIVVFKPQVVFDYWWGAILFIILNIYLQFLKFKLKQKG